MAITNKEAKRRKTVMQRAGIKVPNTDESWGPWWENKWQRATTHTKTNAYYGVPSVWNFMRRTFDEVTGNTTYKAEPQPIGGTLQATDTSTEAKINRALNNWQHNGDPVRDITVLAMSGPSRTAQTTAKAVGTAAKYMGQVATPSTWIGGLSKAAGYTAPNWMLWGADLGLSSKFVIDASNDITQNGLNLGNGLNAAMSLIPMTRSAEAIEGVASAFRYPMQSVNSVVDDFKMARNAFSSPATNLARELNQSVKTTKLINVPVEHVSPNGITRGFALDAGKEGIHLSPVGSSTTYNIQQATGYPFVRTGTWTYSNNTRPVVVQDMGYFGKGVNPDFDYKVARGTTNFSYINNFEGKGNTSYLTTEPSFGLQLSKNIQAPTIDWHKPVTIGPRYYTLPDGTKSFTPSGLESYLGTPERLKSSGGLDKYKYSQNGRDYYLYINSTKGQVLYKIPENDKFIKINSGNMSENIKQAEKAILDSRYNFIESLPDDEIKSLVRSTPINEQFNGNLFKLNTEKEHADILRNSVKKDIDEIYLSDEYISRYMKSLGLDPKTHSPTKEIIRDRLTEDIHNTYGLAKPKVYTGDYLNGGLSQAYGDDDFVYGINTNTESEYLMNDWTSIPFHEFGHNLWEANTDFSNYMRNYNQNLHNPDISDINSSNAIQNIDYFNYISDPDEFRQRIMEGVRYGIKEGNLTPEEIYNECQTTGFDVLKDFYSKEYLVKMLGLMLGTAPVIVNSKNDKSS